MFRGFFIVIPLFVASWAWCQQSTGRLNQLSLSQGISSPSMSHSSLFSNGLSFDNPVAAAYQDGYHLTGSIDGTETTSGGAEVGVGSNQYGVALGAYSNACEEGQECDPYARGVLGMIWGGLGIGFGIQEDLYTVGILLNANGMHRLGFIAEFEDRDGPNNRREAFGLGYAFVIEQFTFSADLSKQDSEDITVADQAYLVTPALALRVDVFSVSVSYDIFINDDNNLFNDQVWFGVSMQAFSDFEFAFYGEYIDRWSLMATYFF